MYWPVILPFLITCCVLPLVVAGFTAAAPSMKWRRGRTFVCASLLAIVGFIPSCSGIMVAVDLVRFGTFRHANQSDMWNDKFKPYVPTAAKNIVIYKHYGGNGFRAKYAISEAEFHAHVNDVWEKWREYHPGELENREDDGRPADSHTFHIYFGDLGWDKWGAVRSYRHMDGMARALPITLTEMPKLRTRERVFGDSAAT